MLPEKPSKENARACVLWVEISDIMVRIVTALPPQKPDRHLSKGQCHWKPEEDRAYLKAIICQTFRDSPNSTEVTDKPSRLATKIGFLPLCGNCRCVSVVIERKRR